MKRRGFCAGLLAASGAGLVTGQVPAPAPIPAARLEDKIPDRFLLAPPGAVRLEGLLGERCRKNERARLLTKNEDDLLGGFRQRPGKQAWVGEHVGKWLHAATLAWVYTGDAELRAKLDRVTAALIAAQQPDGYLGTYADGAHWGMGKEEKWDVWVHKYNLLGLMTYATYTGDQRALEAARRIGDLLVRTFGPGGQLDLNERSTHVGMASGSVLEPMVLLARAANDQRYVDFARFVAEHWEEGQGPRLVSTLTARRSVKVTANAKAYEMLSCLVGLCELYRATGEMKYFVPVRAAWDDIIANQLLATGSGSSKEHWTDPGLFPSEKSADVAETCVTVTWVQLNQQLLRLSGEAKYADELEKTIYNHLAGAQRPDGAAWSYFTAHDGGKPYKEEQNCCTSSGPRGWAMLPTFAYMTTDDGVVVNFFAPGTATLKLRGDAVVVKQETNYPVDGRVKLTVTVPRPMKLALRVRVPAWSSLPGIKAQPGSYWLLRQTWSRSQTITLDFGLPVRLIEGKGANAGRVALARGPLVLAADERFNPVISPPSAVAPAGLQPALKALLNTRDADGLPVWETEGVVTRDIEGHRMGEHAPLRLSAFSGAGAEGTKYWVWLPRPAVNAAPEGSKSAVNGGAT